MQDDVPTGETCPFCGGNETVTLDDFDSNELYNRRCPKCGEEWREEEREEPTMPDKRRPLLKWWDSLAESFALVDVVKLLICAIALFVFYTLVQDILAETRRDREFYREEVRTVHKKNEELVTSVKAVLEETRKEMHERHKREMEGRP